MKTLYVTLQILGILFLVSSVFIPERYLEPIGRRIHNILKEFYAHSQYELDQYLGKLSVRLLIYLVLFTISGAVLIIWYFYPEYIPIIPMEAPMKSVTGIILIVLFIIFIISGYKLVQPIYIIPLEFIIKYSLYVIIRWPRWVLGIVGAMLLFSPIVC